MFDIGSGELVVIGVVALIAIGPKELPGVLRTVGQWVARARRMAGEFQSQFNEAMREAEMADLKKSFDEVTDAARGITSGNVLGATTKEIEDAFKDSTAVTPSAPSEPVHPEPVSSDQTALEQTSSAPSEQMSSEHASSPAVTEPVTAIAAGVPHDSIEGRTGS
jgi:sec-independent protein translocase protein TatB